VFERDDEHEPTDDGRPPRKGERLGYSILWDGRDAKLVCGGAMRRWLMFHPHEWRGSGLPCAFC
jgi:hypothetical protein